MKNLNYLLIFSGLLLFSVAGISQSLEDSPWHVVAKDIDPANYYGVTLANGMIGLISSPEPMKVEDVVLNGVYDYYQRGRVSNILESFNPADMDLVVNGTWVDRNSASNFKQSLDMEHATLRTSFDVGEDASVVHELMALRHLPYTSLSVITIEAKKDIEIVPASRIVAPTHLADVRNYFNEVDRPHVLIQCMTSEALSPSGKHKVAASNAFIFEEHHGEEPRLIHEHWDFNNHLVKFYKNLKAGQTYTFAVVSSSVSSVDYGDPVSEAERLSIYAKLEGVERLKMRHQAAWDELWKSDIILEGDVDVQRDIRFALYHLYSFARKGTAYSLSPMGLSGLGYNGHVFWDTELWMYPPLLILQPEIAKSLLEYRFERLDAAKQNAFAHGYDGAMFPWESAEDGGEDTPSWALTGPFQHHITGCIGWAFWKYYEVTGDKEWLAERGYPVLKEAAKFWVSRVERNGPGNYEINNVIGANEYEENIDNNAFTNGMAQTVLAYATSAAKELGQTPDSDWMHVAENIPILQFPDGTTRENATYDGAVIKQADVNLLAYPLDVIKDASRVKKDVDYYAARMDPRGPAMGMAILAVLYNQLGETENANKQFTQSYKPNKVPPFGVISETAGGTNPYFATGAGGMLQAVLAGFGGLRITPNGIEQISTKLPTGWETLTITGVGRDEKTFKVE